MKSFLLHCFSAVNKTQVFLSHSRRELCNMMFKSSKKIYFSAGSGGWDEMQLTEFDEIMANAFLN
jgi:hypothetical protein